MDDHEHVVRHVVGKTMNHARAEQLRARRHARRRDADVEAMLVGLVALMGTPVARVAMSVVEYGRRRDWTFFVLTLIVLAELCAGIVAALVFHRRL